MFILERNYLTETEITHALNAYVLTCKDKNTELMELLYDNVNAALRIIGKVVSNTIFTEWKNKMNGLLDCQ
jgi:hypothetical protein